MQAKQVAQVLFAHLVRIELSPPRSNQLRAGVIVSAQAPLGDDVDARRQLLLLHLATVGPRHARIPAIRIEQVESIEPPRWKGGEMAMERSGGCLRERLHDERSARLSPRISRDAESVGDPHEEPLLVQAEPRPTRDVVPGGEERRFSGPD